jgi:hypothetical protein
MSRKSNPTQTSGIACTLSLLLLLSTARAVAVEIHVVVPVIHPNVSVVIVKPNVPVVNVKPNVPHIAITTGRVIGGQSNGTGAGKATFNTFSDTKNVDKASPSLFKDATTGKTIGTIANKKIDSSAIQGVGFSSLDATDKATSKILTVNPLPPFNFNKIDPTGKASVVSVIRTDVAPVIGWGDAGNTTGPSGGAVPFLRYQFGTVVTGQYRSGSSGGAGKASVVFFPAVQIQKIVDKSLAPFLQGDINRPFVIGAIYNGTGPVGGNVPFNVGAGTIGSNVSPSTSAGSGPEKPLYRVQIHQGSAGGFNWSRD